MSKKSVVQRSLFEQTVDDTLFSIFKPNKQLKSMDTSIKENPDVVKSCPCDLTEHLRNTVVEVSVLSVFCAQRF